MQLKGIRTKDDLYLDLYLHQTDYHYIQEDEYPEFPCLTYTLSFPEFLGDSTPWYREKEMTFMVVTSGKMLVQTQLRSVTLKEGDICYINIDILRRFAPEPLGSSASADLLIVRPIFIFGYAGSIIDLRYVRPITSNSDIDLILLNEQDPQLSWMRDHLNQAAAFCHSRGYGFEFDVKTHLDAFWKYASSLSLPINNQAPARINRSEARLSAMITYVQDNYMHDITLKDIAGSASISERECFRCFKDTLQITPIHFLQSHRINIAARRLLYTDDSIKSISELTGFTDSSYFGRVFSRFMHCSPREFRQQNRGTLQHRDWTRK